MLRAVIDSTKCYCVHCYMCCMQVQVAVVLTLKATGGSEELQRERPVSDTTSP
jgi:hypothetical protein